MIDTKGPIVRIGKILDGRAYLKKDDKVLKYKMMQVKIYRR